MAAAHTAVMRRTPLYGRRFILRFAIALSTTALLSVANRSHGQGTPPTIIAQPQGRSVSLSANVTFQISASGSSPLDYRWFHDGVPVSRATTNAHSITNVSLADAGGYFVII